MTFLKKKAKLKDLYYLILKFNIKLRELRQYTDIKMNI